MSNLSELFCVMKGKSTDALVLKGEPGEWETLRWCDEFGNSIAPFFTSREAGQRFLEERNNWQLKRYPASFVATAILANIQQGTSFYTIDPVSTGNFKALSHFQFLAELIDRANPLGAETQDPILQHEDIVPIDALLGTERNHDEEVEYRRLLAIADLIFGVDLKSGKQSLVFGRSALEELVRAGKSDILRVVNVGIDQETVELEKLASLVQDIKGYHDYYAAGTR
jgi:hypothetical protein